MDVCIHQKNKQNQGKSIINSVNLHDRNCFFPQKKKNILNNRHP